MLSTQELKELKKTAPIEVMARISSLENFTKEQEKIAEKCRESGSCQHIQNYYMNCPGDRVCDSKKCDNLICSCGKDRCIQPSRPYQTEKFDEDGDTDLDFHLNVRCVSCSSLRFCKVCFDARNFHVCIKCGFT